jgi:hypothetical protein
MATQDTLFRILRSWAESSVVERRRSGEAIEFDQVAAQLMTDLKAIVDPGDQEEALRARLTSLIGELSASSN